ncbi:P-loop containing nucleoside triphosphate hydrolase protein [Pilatotrama ljubarskyi]|nr:P-loop containing nucleoside triphosphate hydrolase protein [Pilatotrama ljubarskyi]
MGDHYAHSSGRYYQDVGHIQYEQPEEYDLIAEPESSSSFVNFHEEYDMYDDVDQLLHDIANSSPSPPDRSQRPMFQTAASPPYMQAPQHMSYSPVNARYHQQQFHPAQYECLEQEPGPSDSLHASYASERQVAERPVPSRALYAHHSPVQAYRQAPPAPIIQNSAYNNGAVDQSTRNWHGTRLRPVSDLPDIYRGLFKFGVFNAVQSQCYSIVMETDENMVISAPTGSGKTVLFELAIIKLLKETSAVHGKARCVYIAPTKSLCAEKSNSFQTKFTPFGAKCSELTGDTVHSGRGAWGDAKDATIIITTGEKWDSLTRNWQDHSHILSQIQLFLIDEVHLLNESRGSTLEVIVSRMKLRGNSVRFIVVSATVPNIVDVADWIANRRDSGPAIIKEFGEEFRPCKLSKFVYGVPRRRDTNDFVFAKALDYKLYGILQQHCHDKPVLVFCATRKGVMIAAEQVLKEYDEAISKKETLPWSKPSRIEHTFSSKQLDKLAACGIGVHHAGLGREDRSATEQLYLKKAIKILFATSTLAVGVNLPAHTVIIKGVKLFQNNASTEYSDLDIMQMMGRAGRPQFDKEGVAIIMCEQELEAKYKALVQGQTVLESSLHLHLAEHLNSEIALGTITNMDSAKDWLHNSFLFRRLQKNPAHYNIKKDGNKSWQGRMDDLVIDSVKTLQHAEMVKKEDEDTLTSTEYGDIMSKFYIRQATMVLILKLSDKTSVREILETISCADEFSDIKFRAGEKQVYNRLRTHNDIRYPIKKIERPSDKVFILIQAILSAINLSDAEYKTGETQPYMESIPILRHISRIARAVVEVAIMRQAGLLVKNALEVMRCLNAKAWEDRSVVFRQLDDIGLKSLKVLAEHNVTTFAALRRMDPGLIETYLNRKPPFGHELLTSVAQLPQYTVAITEIDVSTRKDGVEVALSVDCGLARDIKAPKWKKAKKQKRWDMTLVLTLTSDNAFIDFRRISTAALKESRVFEVTAKLTKPSQTVVVYVTSDTYAGLTVSASYKPKIDAKAFPVMDTRPHDAVANVLDGLEDMPDFWDMSEDELGAGEEADAKSEPLSPAHISSGQPRSSIQASQQKARKVTSPALAALERTKMASLVTAAPKQLPNGKYQCNHTCKDKAACRHLCCREGLPKPPPMTKRRIEMLVDAESVSSQRSGRERRDVDENADEGTRPRSKPKPRPKDAPKLPSKSDRPLKQLEDLHERTGVERSLQLSDGGRIKLERDLAPKSKPIRKPAPNFDVEFFRFEDKPAAISARISEHLSDSDDDDLPGPSDILDALRMPGTTTKAASSASTDYADSEFYALIADLPSAQSVSRPGNTRQDTVSRHSSGTGAALLASGAMDWTPVTPSRKRKQGPQKSTDPARRVKHARTGGSPPFEVICSSERPSGDGTRHYELLFESSLSDEVLVLSQAPNRSSPATSPAPGLMDDEEGFTLDTTLFDIMPSTPTLPGSDGPPPEVSPRSKSSMPRTSNPHLAADVLTNIHERELKESASTPAIDLDDPLAELEAWLQSGAVEFGD